MFFKLTADQVLVFDWVAGSCQVNLLKVRVHMNVVTRSTINTNVGTEN